ncbi:family 48 glycosyltransferase [Melampsora larici-populina 98AG31]|uniref:Family 48 glycosyltransferase n=1 Tax=Melampsora larici-populina (strain 98AG31 / pathotype 3-4-7) TaxID=747676 RepID=F4S3L7_MELLP|nr:family 48 glycosyltransferase [Melampsora larici-populina 98AG31]EGG00692.1 family 48 glycosyltransferase [Melampsora larici-populina 98AG31]
MRNVCDHLMIQLDGFVHVSLTSLIVTLHADYIGGEHANYRKWYFAAQLDLDDAIGQTSHAILGLTKPAKKLKSASAKSLESTQTRWQQAMPNMSSYDHMLRFMPECLCFIFKCADDYYRSPECQNRVEPVPQGYELIDGIFMRREKDHMEIIGYNDINSLFWDPEGIAKIRYMKFDKIEWRQAFFKTYLKKRSFAYTGTLLPTNELTSFLLGILIWTPWSDFFTRLPKQIYAKFLATSKMQARYKPKVLVSQIWNVIIISMYYEHLLSINHVQCLLYVCCCLFP